MEILSPCIANYSPFFEGENNQNRLTIRKWVLTTKHTKHTKNSTR